MSVNLELYAVQIKAWAEWAGAFKLMRYLPNPLSQSILQGFSEQEPFFFFSLAGANINEELWIFRVPSKSGGCTSGEKFQLEVSCHGWRRKKRWLLRETSRGQCACWSGFELQKHDGAQKSDQTRSRKRSKHISAFTHLHFRNSTTGLLECPSVGNYHQHRGACKKRMQPSLWIIFCFLFKKQNYLIKVHLQG